MVEAIDLDEIIVEGRRWPLIPEGGYVVAYTHHETALVFNTPEVFAHFKIVDLGEYTGKRIYGAYRASKLIGKARRGGARIFILSCADCTNVRIFDRIALVSAS